MIGVVRAVIQNNLLYDGPKRLFYMGPMFRHERPQKGRYRQFHQVGIEALGFSGPDCDAEIILMMRSLWREIGLTDIRLEINNLGQPEERLKYRNALIKYFEENIDILDEDAKRRLYTNPLRILDTKNPAMQSIVNLAPKLIDFLGTDSISHVNKVCEILDAVGQPYSINPRLVRGIDYYNLTVFEWVTDRLGSQGTVCGGGRYDNLSKMIGNNYFPAVGLGIGVERVLSLIESNINEYNQVPDAYVIIQDPSYAITAVCMVEKLREHGFNIIMPSNTKDGYSSMKSQFKKADASGARFALIFGKEEIEKNMVSIKSMSGGLQSMHYVSDILSVTNTISKIIS